MQGGLVGPTEARGGGGSGGDERCGGAILEPPPNQGRLLFFGRPAKMGGHIGGLLEREFLGRLLFFWIRAHIGGLLEMVLSAKLAAPNRLTLLTLVVTLGGQTRKDNIVIKLRKLL
jgi:hypothetical protein